MTYSLNETHNPDSWSWVPSANDPAGDFPIQNLPFGLFKPRDTDTAPHVGVAIGNQILDIFACHEEGLFQSRALTAAEACRAQGVNGLIELGVDFWSAIRRRVSELLRANHRDTPYYQEVVGRCLIPASDVDLLLPVTIGDYTDFYASIHHATNVGRMLRPDNPLLPNYKHLPIGYHGRASSVVVSGTTIKRPSGQTRPDESGTPRFGPSRRLDYELEMGLVVGPGNAMGEPIPLSQVERHMFGMCLLNDWSARDIQQWEYQPLGPFLGKSFATTISPWIVTLEAVEPFRAPGPRRAPDDPPPLAYLGDPQNQQRGAIDVTLEVFLTTTAMREQKLDPMRLSQSQLCDLYWTLGQLVAHHTSNGCNLRAGDLIGSGTVSGPSKEARGCLLELAWRGTESIKLPTGEQRTFLEDGDQVVFRGSCSRPGAARIGFGVCSGLIVAG